MESRAFRNWLRVEAARAMMSDEEKRAMEKQVERWMQPGKLRVEFFDGGRWVAAE